MKYIHVKHTKRFKKTKSKWSMKSIKNNEIDKEAEQIKETVQADAGPSLKE